MQEKKHILLKIMFITFLSIIIVGIVFIIYVKFNLNHEIDLSLIRTGASSVTKIFTFERKDGVIDTSAPKELEEERIFLENSEWCSFYDMPNHLKNAFIAVEDHKFYDHNGVDWPRTIKATLNYIFKFEKSGFGGSTITQQLIKNLTGDDMVTPKRKLEEILRALNLEKKLGKNEILELYLNVVYLSQNAYGIQSASHLYFNKDASELSLAECACLASIVKSPTKYDPYKYPENNKNRRELILNMMLSYGMITENEHSIAINEELSINPNIEQEKHSGVYSWFTEKLISDVSKDLINKYNLSPEGALMIINKGGLNIYSTMDTEIQKSVERTFESYIAYLKPQNGKYPEASCVVIDPYTSNILGIAGGVGIKSANRIFNRATDAKRPLGSVIKPLSVYAPAIESNIITYASVYDDTPLLLEKDPWPQNASRKYKGLVSANYALEHSLNTVSVKILNDLGIDRAFDFCKNNFSIPLIEQDKAPSPLALGQLTIGSSLLEVTNAYSAFANGGYIAEPRSYLYVTDNYGNVILSNDFSSKRIIDEDTATIMNLMLSNVVQRGTAKALKLKDIVQVAGKTGTSGNNEDKWFVGYTPYYLCGVWVGYDMPSSVSSNSNSAISIFDSIMLDAHSALNKDERLFDSGNIVSAEFCTDSGKLPTEDCKIDPRLNRVQIGYFKKGTEPTEYCDRHKSVYIDSQSGLLADSSTHILFKRKIALLDYERDKSFNVFDIHDKEYLIKSRTK
ncbi:MAG: transglycosylase domain-containing protein [Clostridia bacterium]|nr:transglycosylase domain-containing protein [Clostridia bacterium]